VFLPVVKTLAAWHLLAGGMQAERCAFSKRDDQRKAAAGRTGSRISGPPWLTRLDHAQLKRRLRSITPTMSNSRQSCPVLSLPTGQGTPKSDRFGDPWVYRFEAFSRLSV
jgi:hypothetical protein